MQLSYTYTHYIHKPSLLVLKFIQTKLWKKKKLYIYKINSTAKPEVAVPGDLANLANSVCRQNRLNRIVNTPNPMSQCPNVQFTGSSVLSYELV